MSEILQKIPKLPGVYVFKNADDEIIYIGKAKNLRHRVSSYFRKQDADWKVKELIKEHTKIEYIIAKNETEALLLEAQLIGKIKPKYNVLLTSGNPFIYILITSQEIPQVKLVRVKKQKGTYFGPFLYKVKARYVYYYIMRTFRLTMCKATVENGCLDYHLNKCAGNCTKDFRIEDYKMRVELARQMLDGNYKQCENMLREQIKIYNTTMEFEKSKHTNEFLTNLTVIFETLKTGFSEKKYARDITQITLPLRYKIDQPLLALEELQILLKLDTKPKTIDCFDISHFQSSYLVGSCIRFTFGIPDKNSFRRFRIQTLETQNDYAALQEIVSRRYRDPENLPDVILIDGGKGQLSAITKLEVIQKRTCISLAKREETIYTKDGQEFKLDIKSHVGQLLIAIRDYAHHFAISYHKTMRTKNFIG